MTDGEKMVWAAVFADHYRKIHDAPPEVLVPGKEDECKKYGDAVLVNAVDNADASVWHLRKVCEQDLDYLDSPHTHSFSGEVVLG